MLANIGLRDYNPLELGPVYGIRVADSETA